MKEVKFDFDNILLVPETISSINSRSEVNVYDEHGMLPIMTAPMDTVVDYKNFKHFIDNRINVVMPRLHEPTFYSGNKFIFHSYGLNEFKQSFFDRECNTDSDEGNQPYYALIDVANGHQQQVFDVVKQAKEKYGERLSLMVGNVANPYTFNELAALGVDYIRIGIGNGAACLTSASVGVGYPMASLIKECYERKKFMQWQTKIVADGGCKKYADVIKALALGADYVMLGSMLNKCFESTGKMTVSCDEYLYGESEKSWEDYQRIFKPTPEQIKEVIKRGSIKKKFRGMSTKEVQADWGRENLKTSEGIVTFSTVEYTLAGFVENLSDHLRSAMSYTNSRTLEEFKNSQYCFITPEAFKRFDK